MSTLTTTRIFAAAAGSAALVLTGVAGAQGAPDSTDEGSFTTVSRADIDGDGNADRVELSVGDTKADGTADAELRVTLATGEVTSTTTEIDASIEDPYLGSADVTGATGYEMVLITDQGAHTTWHRVITFQAGSLPTVKDPNGAWRWMTDSSATSAAGYQRAVDDYGNVTMSAVNSVSDDGGRSFERTRSTSVWEDGGWSVPKRVTDTVGSERAHQIDGWKVPYLKTR